MVFDHLPATNQHFKASTAENRKKEILKLKENNDAQYPSMDGL